jgi:hypothetical protein
MKYLDWIDDYITGEITPERKLEFEAALKSIPALKAEYNLALYLVQLIEKGPPRDLEHPSLTAFHGLRNELFVSYNLGKLDKKARLSFEAELKNDPLLAFEWEEFRYSQKKAPLKLNTNKYKWMLAASLIGILCIVGWFSFFKSSIKNENLFAKYDQQELFPKSDYALVNEGVHHRGIGGSENFNNLKIEGLKAYDAQNWPESIRLLSEYLSVTQPSSEELPDEINLIRLYIGRAWLELNDTKKAIDSFQQGIAGVENEVAYGKLQELMIWQLTLAHLKNQDFSSAKATASSLLNARRQNIREIAQSLINDLK